MAKPGTERNGMIWTGETWVYKPKLKAQQISLKKKIEEFVRKGYGNATTAANAEKSWKSRSAKSGTVSSGVASTKRKPPTIKPPGGPKPQTTADKRDRLSPAKPKTKPEPPKQDVKNPPRGGSSSSSSPSRGSSTSKAPAKKAPTVSQSRTQWVKKGDVVGGKTVTKGYVAQYGKPEKKVTANVKLVTDTSRGKAGQKVSYTKGRATKKGK
jgi:hypothetical protein